MKVRPGAGSDNASVDQAHIPADNPADNRPQALPRLSVKPQFTMPGWAMAGRPTSPLRPRVHAPQQEEQRSGWVGQAPGCGRGDRAPRVCLAREGGAARESAGALGCGVSTVASESGSEAAEHVRDELE